MSPSFNLLDKPWIPCVMADGRARELSVMDTLLQAHAVAEVVGDAPPVTVAMVRLLLAVLHRCFGPDNEGAWHALWQRGKFDPQPIDNYLAQVHPYFDLFDHQR